MQRSGRDKTWEYRLLFRFDICIQSVESVDHCARFVNLSVYHRFLARIFCLVSLSVYLSNGILSVSLLCVVFPHVSSSVSPPPKKKTLSLLPFPQAEMRMFSFSYLSCLLGCLSVFLSVSPTLNPSAFKSVCVVALLVCQLARLPIGRKEGI